METLFIALIAPLLGLLAWKLGDRLSTVSGPGAPASGTVASGPAPASGFTTLIGELTSGFDLNAATQRKSAYIKCYEEDDEPYIAERTIAAGAVVALCMTEEPPLRIYLSKDKIYRIVKFEECDGREGIPYRRIRESITRMYVFTLVDDRGQEIDFALDLDDENIVYFTFGDLEQLIQ